MTALEFNHQLLGLEDNLLRFAHGLTSDKDNAKDLLQESMLKALVFKDHFSDHTNLKAWIYTIMKNTFINSYRCDVRHKTAFDKGRGFHFLTAKKDAVTVSPDTVYAVKEINKVIDSLDDTFKVPFKMLMEGYKYKEISEKLGLNLGTVKSRIFFTRKKLMDSLIDYR